MRRSFFSFAPAKQYLFYQLKTTGFDCFFDRPFQFTGVLTDERFNEIGKYNWQMRLPNNVNPDPKAALHYQFPLKKSHKGDSEYTFHKKIRELFSLPNTISFGFNPQAHEAEFLKVGFYHNLLMAYGHKHHNESNVADLYAMTLMYWLSGKDLQLNLSNLKRQAIPDQFFDFKKTLDLKNPRQNNAAVMMNWAKKLHGIDSDLWDKMISHPENGDGKSHLTIENSLSFRLGKEWIAVGFALNVYEQKLCPVINLVNNETFSKKAIWLRLDAFDHAFFEAHKDQILEKDIATSTFELGLQVCIAAPIISKINNHEPMILPSDEKNLSQLSEESITRMYHAIDCLIDKPDLLRYIRDFYLTRNLSETDKNDRDYVTRFSFKEDRELLEAFHIAFEPAEKMDVANKIKNKALYQLAVRIIGDNFPEALDERARQIYQKDKKVFLQGERVEYWDDRSRYPASSGLRNLKINLAEKSMTQFQSLSKSEQKYLKNLKGFYQGNTQLFLTNLKRDSEEGKSSAKKVSVMKC